MQKKFNRYIKWVLFLGFCITTAFILIHTVINSSYQISDFVAEKSSTKPSFCKNDNAAKEQRWQTMEQEVASWGDALGRGIDHEIKNTVIVLNLLGFRTEQSCQGHIDWGLSYPWISFNTQDEEINVLHNKRNDIFKLIDEKESEIQKKYPDLSLGEALRKEQSEELTALYQQNRQLNDTIDKLSKLKLVPLNNLITEFYKKRPIDRDKMLAFQVLDRIYSLGGNWQITRSDNERLKKLKEYQEEMKLFTNFLICCYFEKQD